MNDSFRLFPEAASIGASEVDTLSLALLGITTVFSAGIALAIIFFIVRYWHTREVNRQSGHSNLIHWIVELSWSIGPLLILLMMFVWGTVVYVRAHQPPQHPIEVYVVAKQWMWKVGHNAGRREINELHMPIGTPVRLTMISEDVVHSFFVPAFRIKQDVLPGRYTTLWFDAIKPGTYHLFCAEYCGTDHSRMIGKVVVQTPEEYASWLEEDNSESMEQRGRRLIESIGCMKCHGVVNGEQAAPSFAGLYGSRVPTLGGEMSLVDDAFVRTSILDPQAQTHQGFKPIMPSFDGQLSPEQIMDITAYMRSVGQAAANNSLGKSTARAEEPKSE
jgi:cytochrome c oxidase subunit II